MTTNKAQIIAIVPSDSLSTQNIHRYSLLAVSLANLFRAAVIYPKLIRKVCSWELEARDAISRSVRTFRLRDDN